MNEEIIADFTRIFNLLIRNGADKEDIKAMYEKYKKRTGEPFFDRRVNPAGAEL